MGEIAHQRGCRSKCLICGGMSHRPIFNEFGIDILKCRKCNHVFSSFEADPHYDGFWGEEIGDDDHYYWSKARSRMHQDFFRRFLAGRSGRILDIGCGLGFFLKAMAQYKNWEAYGCEISSTAVRYARERLGLSNVMCSRLADVDLPERYFDIITIWDVLEHILEPDPLLKRCHALLKDGGICFIRTPNVLVQVLRARVLKLLKGMRDNLVYLQARDHLHGYSMSDMRALLGRNRFSRIEFIHLHPIGSVLARKGRVITVVKEASFESVRALDAISKGRLNFDNLFVVAIK